MTSPRPELLFYCQHSLGMGHLVRSLALAEALAERFRVVLLNGGRLPDCVTPPHGIEMVDLPPLGMDTDMNLMSHDGTNVEDAQQMRQKIILDTYTALRPEAILIELFPFGRKKFSGELLPLLDAARKTPSPPLVVCSLRDILVSRTQKDDDKAVDRANNYFDAVLVHSDPSFARLEESFHPNKLLHVPVHYTGYVTPAQKLKPLPATDRKRRVVVSAGGGIVGEPLLRAAIQAYPALRESEGIEMKIIGGPFLPEEKWQELSALAAGMDGLLMERSVTDLYAELCSATASVSQCGYNTALELLQSKIAALVVPFDEGSESEQMNRARRLESLGALHVLKAEELTPARLAEEIRALLRFKPKQAKIDLNGADNSALMMERLVRNQRLSEKQNVFEAGNA
jgi:predicted glycosyltransferase